MNKSDVLKGLLDVLDAESIKLKELRNLLLLADKTENARDVEDIANDMNNLKSNIVRNYKEVIENMSNRNFLNDNVD
jgi:hypothetical protein